VHNVMRHASARRVMVTHSLESSTPHTLLQRVAIGPVSPRYEARGVMIRVVRKGLDRFQQKENSTRSAV